MKCAPIILVSQTSQVTYDDAGGQIIKATGLPASLPTYAPSVLPPHFKWPTTFSTTPPLAYFSIKRFMEKLDMSGKQEILKPNKQPMPYPEGQEPDLLQLLIPHMHRTSRAVKWKCVDPKLWITLIRLYWPETLPQTFQKYPLPLADPYLPYIQFIEPTDHFTLITVLDLKNKKELTDDNIVQLKSLHQLAVLECYGTAVTGTGIKRLAGTLQLQGGGEDGSRPRGTWRLRVLGLSKCNVDDSVVASLQAFPLLSVVDLRDTACTIRPTIQGWPSELLEQDNHTDLFHPAPASDRIAHLSVLASLHRTRLFPSADQPPFSVVVDTLFHPKPPPAKLEFRQSASSSSTSRSFPEQNGYFILGPDGRTGSGSVDVLEKKEKLKEQARKAGERDNSRYLDRSKFDPAADAELKWEEYCRRSGVFSDAATTPAQPEAPPSDDEEAAQQRRREALQEARMEAFLELTAITDRLQVEANTRKNREGIERSRDARALSARDRLNRQLVLIRLPPSYSTLESTIQKKISHAARTKMIEDSQKRELVEQESVAKVNKKRKTETDMWADIKKSAVQPKAVATKSSGAPSQAKGRKVNPWSRPPTKDPKKRVSLG